MLKRCISNEIFFLLKNVSKQSWLILRFVARALIGLVSARSIDQCFVSAESNRCRELSFYNITADPFSDVSKNCLIFGGKIEPHDVWNVCKDTRSRYRRLRRLTSSWSNFFWCQLDETCMLKASVEGASKNQWHFCTVNVIRHHLLKTRMRAAVWHTLSSKTSVTISCKSTWQ